MLSEPTGRTRVLSKSELKRLLEAAATDPVMRAAVVVSIATGLRQGELLRMSWADVNLDDGKLTIPITKTDNPRTVHLRATVVEALRRLKKLKLVSAVSVFLDDDGTPLRSIETARHSGDTPDRRLLGT
jgi:integrase